MKTPRGARSGAGKLRSCNSLRARTSISGEHAPASPASTLSLSLSLSLAISIPFGTLSISLSLSLSLSRDLYPHWLSLSLSLCVANQLTEQVARRLSNVPILT